MTWAPPIDQTPPMLKKTATKALTGHVPSMIRLFCSSCVGYEHVKSLQDCMPCCPLYGFRKGRPDRPGVGGWTSPACSSCTEVTAGTTLPPTFPRFPAAKTIAEAKRGLGCRAGPDAPSTAEIVKMPYHRTEAIKLHCAACMGDSGPAADCSTTTCWLWPRRGGRGPASTKD